MRRSAPVGLLPSDHLRVGGCSLCQSNPFQQHLTCLAACLTPVGLQHGHLDVVCELLPRVDDIGQNMAGMSPLLLVVDIEKLQEDRWGWPAAAATAAGC
jgi:hypothetical protein